MYIESQKSYSKTKNENKLFKNKRHSKNTTKFLLILYSKPQRFIWHFDGKLIYLNMYISFLIKLYLITTFALQNFDTNGM